MFQKSIFYYIIVIVLFFSCKNSLSDNTDESESTTGNSADLISIGFGNINDSLVEIIMSTSDDVGGFQFKITGLTINAAHGGIAEDSGFTVSFGDTGVVLGFSMSGNIIPATSDGILTNLSYTNITSEICINDVVLSDPNGIALEIDLIGDCIEY